MGIYLALGDSVSIDDYTGVRGGGAPSQLAPKLGLDLVDLTHDGNTTQGVLADLGLAPAAVDIVTLTAAGNDLLCGELPRAILSRLHQIAERIQPLGAHFVHQHRLRPERRRQRGGTARARSVAAGDDRAPTAPKRRQPRHRGADPRPRLPARRFGALTGHGVPTAPAANYRSTIWERSTGRELFEIPILLGGGVPFSLPGTPQRPLELKEHHAFPDRTIRHVYTLK